MKKLIESDKEYLRNYINIFPSRNEAEQYLHECLGRVQVVMSWLSELQPNVHSVLELGSNPYFQTLLMQKHFLFDLQLGNYFGDSSRNGMQRDVFEAEGKTLEFPFQHFNIEKDRFPYADSSFDLVLFCEIIEHLLLSSDAPVSEIQRVLRPGGYIIISTPNAVRLANFARLIRGENVYASYSKHGAYGRHNREYTLSELEALLRKHGFEVVKTEVTNVYPHSWKAKVIQSLRPRTWKEHLFVLGRKITYESHIPPPLSSPSKGSL